MRSVSVMTSLRLSPGMKWTVFLPMKCTVLQISTVKFSGQFKAVMDFLPYCINAAKLIIVNILQFNGLRFGFSRKLQSSVMGTRSEEHTSELQSRPHLVCRLLLEKKKYSHYTH